MSTRTAHTAPIANGFHFQTRVATRKNMTVVMAIVPVTASP